MKIFTLITIFSAALLMCLPSFSQDKFSVDFDYSIYKYDNSKQVYLELYYAFDQSQLLFQKTSAGFEASGRLSIQLLNKAAGKLVLNKLFRVPVTLSDTSGPAKSKKLVGEINVVIDTGEYKLTLEGCDFNDTAYVIRKTEDINAHGFSESVISMSSVELSTGITKSADQQNVFYKNTLEVVPNPSLLYGNNLVSMYYYFEIYNIQKSQAGDNYQLVFNITDSKGNNEYSDTKKYAVSASSKVEIGNIDVSKLPTDKYEMLVEMKKEDGTLLARSSKTFYTFNPKVTEQKTEIVGENDFLLSEYAKYSDAQLESDYTRMIYILSDAQKKQYEKLNDIDAKRLWMFKFWKASTLTHKDYFSRIAYANKNFKSNFLEGWKTDQGRVYSIYGPYDDIDRHSYESDKRAYEVWTYNNIQGGVIFVFIDQSSGSSNWQLVHSTAQNEIRDDDWQTKLDFHR